MTRPNPTAHARARARRRTRRILATMLIVTAIAMALCAGFLHWRRQEGESSQSQTAAYATDARACRWDDDAWCRTIDWDALLARNPDVAVWLYAPGTFLDAPVVQEREEGVYWYSQRNLDGAWDGVGTLLMPAPALRGNGTKAPDALSRILGHHVFGSGGQLGFTALHDTWGSHDDALGHPHCFAYLPDGTVIRYRVAAAWESDGNDPVYAYPITPGGDQHAALIEYAMQAGWHDGTLAMDRPLMAMATCADLSGTRRTIILWQADMILDNGQPHDWDGDAASIL